MTKWKLLWPIVLTLLVPLVVAWFVYPDHLPPGFGRFPPDYHGTPPGFSMGYFLLMLYGVIGMTLFLVFPSWFGFKGGPVPPRPVPAPNYPWWFWVGGVCMLFFWWLMWTRVTPFGSLVYYAFTPLWLGVIFLLDGIVYKRNSGKSLFSTKPVTLFLSFLVSTVGWVYFEYYDYFVLGNWYYPNARQIPWSETTMHIEFLITYSTITPVFFQWYSLFNTFPKFAARYQNGPKMPLNGNVLILAGLAIIAAMVYWPYPMFWAVWIGPFVVMTGILLNLGIWNPFTDIAKGNWTAGIFMALASMFNGFVWEFWNYGSMHPSPEPITNPNYWVYNIPYVDVIHIFSEMPLLGYFGYLPFGVLVWQTFIWAGNLCGFNTDISLVSEQGGEATGAAALATGDR
ncbi:MAG: mechanosensitive ion channel protein MscS [Gammaproteobacteria bacterium]|nr:mechanosensitive ion channel protein MscS [Gammaproteobacteria bacterium]